MEAPNLQDISSQQVTICSSQPFPESWIDEPHTHLHQDKDSEAMCLTQARASYRTIPSANKSIRSAPELYPEDISEIYEDFSFEEKRTSRLLEENIAISNESILTGLVADLNNADLTRKQAGWTLNAIENYFRDHFDQNGSKHNQKAERMTILMGYALLTIMEIKQCLQDELRTQYEKYLFTLGQKEALSVSIKVASELERMIRHKEIEMRKAKLQRGQCLFGRVMQDLASERKRIITQFGSQNKKIYLDYWLSKIFQIPSDINNQSVFYQKKMYTADTNEDTCLGIDIDLKQKDHQGKLARIEEHINEKSSISETVSECTIENAINTENLDKSSGILEEKPEDIIANDSSAIMAPMDDKPGDQGNPNEDDNRQGGANRERESLPSTCDTSHINFVQQQNEPLEGIFQQNEEPREVNQTINKSVIIESVSEYCDELKSEPIITVDQTSFSCSSECHIEESLAEKLVFQYLGEKEGYPEAL